MNDNLITPEVEAFKAKWIGREVKVIDPKHPHYRDEGEVTDIERTPVGWGMKIKCNDSASFFYGEEFYIFNGKQIKLI